MKRVNLRIKDGKIIADNGKEFVLTCLEDLERLQKQLNEANEVISIYRIYDDTECGKATEYCKKWGVK